MRPLQWNRFLTRSDFGSFDTQIRHPTWGVRYGHYIELSYKDDANSSLENTRIGIGFHLIIHIKVFALRAH
ncbi:Uncharacterized protein HZ326_31602 [Fusarium oxysporum f. sp. albedinis]|nr:Uncharacterized protein HZ326_31602 [Fusarium oxysporum f. sp. albedinis]